MIPVTLPRTGRVESSVKHFQCHDCLGMFRVRGAGYGRKRFCVECSEVRRLAKEGAQRRVRNEIKYGRLKPATAFKCVDCGEPADRYDHRDYTKPTEVDPVCCRCNLHRGPARL